MQTIRRIIGRARPALAAVTPLGWTVLVLAALTWTAGVVWGWQELLVFAGASLVLAVIAVLFTIGHHELEAGVTVDPVRVVVGERAAGELSLTNLRNRSVRSMRVELPVGKALAVFAVPHLKGRASTDELFVVPTNRRAIIPVGPVVSVKGDPLGLLRRTQQWSDVRQIFVHPRTTRLSTFAAGLIRDLEGQTTSALSSSDIAFHTLRDYVAGDDLRHVHWKSSAKIGELMVRQYNDTRRSHVAVLLSTDLDEYASDDEFELAISCAASVAVQAMRDEQTLTMIAGGEQFPIHDPTRLLDRFSGIEGARGAGSIESSLRAARRVANDASVAVVCVGSTLGITDVRRATNKAAIDMSTTVLRAAIGSSSNYLVVGNSTFLDVPDLDALHHGLGATVAA